MSMSLLDHVALGESMIPAEFRGKPNFAALVRSRSEQAQEIENAFRQLFSLASIDASEEAQLDVIGRIVGFDRGGRDDARYRVWLRAWQRLLRGSGRPRDVLQIVRLAVGSAPTVSYAQDPPAAFIVRVFGLTDDADALRELLTHATDDGIRSLLSFSDLEPDALFVFDVAPGWAGVFVEVIDNA